MKYKTLFRLLLKAVGVMLIGSAIPEAFFAAMNVIDNLLGNQFVLGHTFTIGHAATWLTQSAFGLYLFFGGKWIADLAIPGNRPYCPECGYDLTGATESRCPECGTPFSSKDILPPGQK